MIKSTLSLVLLGIILHADKATSAVDVMTPEALFPQLDAVLVSASQNAPRVIADLERLHRAEAETQIHSSPRYPSVSAALQGNIQKEQRTVAERSGTTARAITRFDVSQALYHWGALKANTRIGELQQAIAADNLDESVRLIGLEVRYRFLDLVILNEELARAMHAETVAKQMLDLRERGHQDGYIARNELEQMRRAYADSVTRIENVRLHLSQNWDLLRALTGNEEAVPKIPSIPNRIPDFVVDAESVAPLVSVYLLDGVHDATAVRIAEHQSEIAQSRKVIADARLKPKVDFSAGFTQDNTEFASTAAEDDIRSIAFAGIRFRWNLFDGRATRAFKLASLAELREAEGRRMENLDRLRVEMSNLYSSLQIHESRIARDLQALDSAGELLLLKEREVSTGYASMLEHEHAKEAATAARFTLDQHRADYLKTVASIISLALCN